MEGEGGEARRGERGEEGRRRGGGGGVLTVGKIPASISYLRGIF